MYSFRRLITFAVISFSPCLIASEQTNLRIGMLIEPITSFFPLRQSPGQSHFVRSLVNPPVISRDSSWEWTCQLCDEIPSYANGKVRINSKAKFPFITEWKLRSDLKWADGTSLTAEDVKQTMGIIFRQSRDGPIPTLPLFKVDVHPKDPLRFYVSFQEPRYDFHQIMAVSLLPAHKLEDLRSKIEEEEEWEQYLNNNLSELESKSWYYGRYFVESLRSQEIHLAPSPNLSPEDHRQLPKIAVVMKRNLSQIQQAVHSAELDMLIENSISAREAVAIIARQNVNRSNYRLLSSPSSTLDQLVVNLRNPYLSDVKMRQALMISIDRDQLVETAYHNHGAAAYDLLPPKNPQAPGMRNYPYNPERAGALLDSLGWKLGENNRRFRHGQALELQIVIADLPEHQAMARLIQSYWERVGIGTDIIQYNAQEFSSRILPTRRFRDVALASLSHLPDSYWFGRFDSRHIPRPNNSHEGANFGSWQNRRMDGLLASYQQAFSSDDTKRIETQIIQKIFQNVPIIPLVFQPKVMIVRDSFLDVTLSSHQFHSSLLSPEWTASYKDREVF